MQGNVREVFVPPNKQRVTIPSTWDLYPTASLSTICTGTGYRNQMGSSQAGWASPFMSMRTSHCPFSWRMSDLWVLNGRWLLLLFCMAHQPRLTTAQSCPLASLSVTCCLHALGNLIELPVLMQSIDCASAPTSLRMQCFGHIVTRRSPVQIASSREASFACTCAMAGFQLTISPEHRCPAFQWRRVVIRDLEDCLSCVPRQDPLMPSYLP